jgi:hypothetical protein
MNGAMNFVNCFWGCFESLLYVDVHALSSEAISLLGTETNNSNQDL